MIRNRKAQVATEFMLIVGLALVVVIMFSGLIYYLSFRYSEDQNIKRLQDLGYSLQSELILASEVEPGYERTIIIPDDVGGADYSISQTSADLVIRYKETELLFPIPKVTGSLSKGTNTITKPDENTVLIT